METVVFINDACESRCDGAWTGGFFCNIRVKNVWVRRGLLSSLKHRDPSWSGCQWSIQAKDPTGRDWARIHGEWDSDPGDPRLSRSVCWHSLTPLTFSLTLYQNVFLSHTPPAESPQPPPTSSKILVQLFHLVVRSDIRVTVRAQSRNFPMRFCFISRNKDRKFDKSRKVWGLQCLRTTTPGERNKPGAGNVFYLVLKTSRVPK